jgi:tetratricopeptide (TPR) repeat protein
MAKRQSKPKKHSTPPSTRSRRVAAEADMHRVPDAQTHRTPGAHTHRTGDARTHRAPDAHTQHAPAAPPPANPAPPVRRSTYFEAVAVYERGLEALQRHDYPAAIERLESVLRLYPEEKELHERVRLYLSICQRQVLARVTAPRTIEERLYASTLAINGGNYEEAISHLRLVRDEDPDNEHALYMLAVAHTQRGEHAQAVAHLERAIALNPENRSLARRDPDLEPLRGDEAFRAALDAAPASPPRVDPRRRPVRTKSAR